MTSNVNEQKEQKEAPKLDLTKKLTLDKVVVQDGGFVIADAKDQKPTVDRRIFMRADYNVPLDNNQAITDDTRIKRTIPTIKHLLSLNPRRLIINSHLGRPKGNITPKMSLRPVVQRLEELLGGNIKITFVENWFRDDFDLAAELNKLPDGSVVMLENSRFYIEEEGKGLDKDGNKAKANPANVEKFRALLSSLCDLYVNDAFGCCHRAHSTMVGFNVALKSAGFLVKKELEYFDRALSKPQRPYLAILGGAKVSDKILVIESLLSKVDEMIVAGGMCFTFLKVLNGISIGNSLFDKDGAEIVKDLVKKAEQNNVKIIFPVDLVCNTSFANDGQITKADLTDPNCKGVPDGNMALDIGEKSIALMEESILRSKTIVFNGPPGVFEFPNFENGTKKMIQALVKTTKDNGATSIVGGGDSASAVNKYGAANGVSHVSTGGGASLELLEGKLLPGVVALTHITG